MLVKICELERRITADENPLMVDITHKVELYDYCAWHRPDLYYFKSDYGRGRRPVARHFQLLELQEPRDFGSKNRICINTEPIWSKH